MIWGVSNCCFGFFFYLFLGCRSLGPLFLPFAFLCLLFRFLFVYFLCMSWNLCSWVPCLIYLLFTDQKKMIWGIWTSLLVAMGIAWVLPLLVKDLIIGLKRIPVRKDERKVWRAAPYVCYGQFGREGIDWCLKMSSSLLTG